MTTSSPRPANVPWLIPYLTVQDVDKAADFYVKAFKFEAKELVPGEDGTTWHAELIYQDQMIMLGKENAWGNTTKPPVSNGIESPMGLYLYTQDVDKFYQQALANEAQSVSKPEDMFWGDRMCRLKDLDGFIWSFGTHLQIK